MGRTYTSLASLAPCIGALELFLCWQKKLCLVGQPGNCLSTWISFLAVAPKQNWVIGRKRPEWLVVCGWGLEAELVSWGEERKGVRTPKFILNFLFRICLSHKDTLAQMLISLNLMKCPEMIEFHNTEAAYSSRSSGSQANPWICLIIYETDEIADVLELLCCHRKANSSYRSSSRVWPPS